MSGTPTAPDPHQLPLATFLPCRPLEYAIWEADVSWGEVPEDHLKAQALPVRTITGPVFALRNPLSLLQR